MRAKDPLAQAYSTIQEALLHGDEGDAARAAELCFALVSALLAGQGEHRALAALAKSPVAAKLDEPAHRPGALVTALLPLLASDITTGFHLLLRVLHPRWMNGAEDALDHAPPFAEVKDALLAAIQCGKIDVEGQCAILIGRYGPDAKEVLPFLVRRLTKFRRDCSKAAGLVWAVYQIGGMSRAVKRVLLLVARDEQSCPHARPIALEILRMNQVKVSGK